MLKCHSVPIEPTSDLEGLRLEWQRFQDLILTSEFLTFTKSFLGAEVGWTRKYAKINFLSYCEGFRKVSTCEMLDLLGCAWPETEAK